MHAKEIVFLPLVLVSNQKFCKDKMGDILPMKFWTSMKSGLESNGLFGWFVCEKNTKATPHSNVVSLKTVIIEVWASYPEDVMAKAWNNFHLHIEAVIEVDGAHIE